MTDPDVGEGTAGDEPLIVGSVQQIVVSYDGGEIIIPGSSVSVEGSETYSIVTDEGTAVLVIDSNGDVSIFQH